MKIFSASIVALLIIFQSIGFAATKNFSASGEYTMSDYDTQEIAEMRALDYARRNASEQAGIYLESYSRTVNLEFESDEIKTVANQNIKIVGEPKISRELLPGDVVKIRVDINTIIDTADLEAVLTKSDNERQHAVEQYESLKKLTIQLDEDTAELKRKIAALKDGEPDDEISAEQERLNREFLSKQMLEEFTTNFGTGDKIFAYDVTLIDKAIKLNPKNFQAYAFRSMRELFQYLDEIISIDGTSYNKFELKKLTLSIRELNKGILLAPDKEKPALLSALGLYYKLNGNNDEANKFFNEALAGYNRMIESDPNNTDFYIKRGDLYGNQLEDYDKALADYNKAIKLAPKNANIYKERSKLNQKLKNYSDALKDFQTYKKLAAKNFDASDYLNLGDIYKELQDYPKALENYTKAIDSVDQSNNFDTFTNTLAYVNRAQIYIELGELDKAVDDCDNAIAIAEKNEFNFFVTLFNKLKQQALEKKVESLCEAGDYNGAVEVYTKVIDSDPNYQDAYFYRGKIYIDNLANYEAAVSDYNKLLELDPNYGSSAYNNRGVAYENLGELDKALADYDKAIELDPNNELAKNNRQDLLNKINSRNKPLTEVESLTEQANSLRDNKNYSAAVDAYTKVLELAPNNQDAYFQRGLMYLYTGKYDLALNDYNKLIEINPNYDVNAYNNRGVAYSNLGETDKAIADFTRTFEMDSSNKIAIKNRGDCHNILKNYEQAVADYTQALTLDANYQDAYFQRGLTYINAGKYDLAVADYDKLIALNPNYHSNAYNNRGVAYENLGELKKALADYDKAIEFDPNNELAKNNRQRVLENMDK